MSAYNPTHKECVRRFITRPLYIHVYIYIPPHMRCAASCFELCICLHADDHLCFHIHDLILALYLSLGSIKNSDVVHRKGSFLQFLDVLCNSLRLQTICAIPFWADIEICSCIATNCKVSVPRRQSQVLFTSKKNSWNLAKGGSKLSRPAHIVTCMHER